MPTLGTGTGVVRLESLPFQEVIRTMPRATRNPVLTMLAIAGAALALVPAGASAQDALGDGSALDANQRRGAGGRNTQGRWGRDARREAELRNAIVTGNAAGGRSFRGDVGYRATDDFRGALGSNDLFEFERDSFYSGLATTNVRGLGALQFGLEQSTANQANGIRGGLIINRAGIGASSSQLQPADTVTISIDPFGHLRGSIRSTTDYLVQSKRFPRVLDNEVGPDGLPVFLTATSLQGIKPLNAANTLLSLTPDLDQQLATQRNAAMDANRALAGRALDLTTEQSAAPAGGAMGERIEPEDAQGQGVETGRVQNAPVGQREESIVSTASHEQLLIDLRVRAMPASEIGATPERTEQAPDARRIPDGMDEYQESLDRLRESLETQPDAGAPESLIPGADPRTERPDDENGDAEETDELDRFLEEADRLIGGGQLRLDALIDAEGVDSIYGLHMKRGQELLAEDRWFDAEERFSAALRAEPGDPLAAAGRLTAQLGAGMFRSASINLRNLLTAYPEMINAQVPESLFPRDERLEAVRDHLKLRAERDSALARDAALLLAFVGAQTGNRADIQEGFDAIERIDASEQEREGDTAGLSKLETLLRAQWLER